MDNSISETKSTEELVGILLNECQSKDSVHLMNICLELLKGLQCSGKDISIEEKVSIERSFLRIMHYYLEITCEHIQTSDIIVAELLGAMLQTFSSVLQISDFELIPYILSQNKAKQTRGLFLLRAITRNISKLPGKELVQVTPLWQYKRAAARLFGETEVFDCIINKFSDKKQNKNFFKSASHIHSAIQDSNTEYYTHRVIVECIVQMKDNLSQKQKKQAYDFLVSALPILPSLIEINIDITFPYFSLLRQINPHFQAGKEIDVFNSFTIYLRHFEPIIGEESRNNWKTTMTPAIDSMNLGVSIFEDVISSSSLKSGSSFISAMVDFMFAMCELDFIFFEDSDFYALGESIGSSQNQNPSGTKKNGSQPDNMEHDQVFVDFQYHLESISQSRKKTFLNDHLFERISKYFTQEKQDKRRILGCYNMLYYQTKFNADPIRLVLTTVMKFIPSHLKTQQLFSYAVRFLFQMAMSAINYLTPHHEQFMPIVIQTACISEDTKNELNNNDQQRRQAQGDIFIGLSLVERVFSRIVYEEDFALFDYIPGVYQFCLKKCNQPNFFQKPSYYQELVRHLINCILHKKKVENYIASFVQESKQVFLAPLENKDISATPSLATGLSCLSCLAKMVLKSENCKDDDLVRRVKQLLLYYSKLVHNGNFDHSNYLRTEIYQFIYSIQMDQLEDQKFVEKLFLYLYKRLLKDCSLNTNVTLIKRNGNQIGVLNLQNQDDHEGQMFQQEELNDYIGNNNNNNNHNNQQNDALPGQQVQQNMQQENDDENDDIDEEDESDIDDGGFGENIVHLDIENFLNEDEAEEDVDEFDDDDEDNENYEQFYFEPPNVELVDLKSHALYLLGDFMDVCVELVMDYKKFEIVDILKKNSLHDREENSIIYMNYQTIGQMLLCAHTYFSKYHSDLYLTPVNQSDPKKLPTTVISDEARVEIDPLVMLTLASIDNLDKVNDDNIHEEMLAKLSYVLRHLDVNAKQSYFNQYFKSIRKNIRKTLYLSQSSLLDKQMECLQSLFKAAPFEIPQYFNQIWEIFQNHFFYSSEDKTVKEEIPNPMIKLVNTNNNNNNRNQINSTKSEGKESNSVRKVDQQIIQNQNVDNNNDNNEDDWEEVSDNDEDKQNKQSKQNQDNKVKPIRLARDLSQIHSFVGFVSHFIKYHPCVYEKVSPVMNQILLGTTVLKDEILFRNSIYFMNVAIRYCYDSIPADVFNNIFNILSVLITQQKSHTFEEKGSLENIQITYALMAYKILETNRKEYYNNIDNTSQPFKVLLSALPFESDFAEMKRVMQVVRFLFEKQSPLIIQYLHNIISSIVHIVNEPLRYKIKKLQSIVQLFELIKQKFPQAENIVRAILIRNESNHFKQPRVILGVLNMKN